MVRRGIPCDGIGDFHRLGWCIRWPRVGVLIAGVWMIGLLSGGLLTVGVIALATGRVDNGVRLRMGSDICS